MDSLKIVVNQDLELKLLKLEDAKELFELTEQNRSYLRKWLSWLDKNQTIEDTKKFIQTGLEKFEKDKGFELGIWYQDQLIGCIGLPLLNKDHNKAVIGYWLSQEFQGQGIMTEVVKGLVNYLFKELKLNRVEINCAIGNEKSCAIPQRLGFACEGTIRQAEWLYDHYVDWYKYAILASEWNKGNTSRLK